MKRIAFIIILLAAAAGVPALSQSVRTGTVTFISGEVYYTSLGRTAGVADSALLYVTKGADTTAILRVFALSSKSSACSLAGGTKSPRVGDTVRTTVSLPEPAPVAADTTRRPEAGAEAPRKLPEPPREGVIQGRVSLQYRTYFYAGSNADITQPSMALSLRGSIPGSPVRFELQGSIRATVLGSQNPFSSSGINQSRIYRAAVSYDDGVTRAELGRLLAGIAAASATIDGIMVHRRFGPVRLGAAAGFEPDFSQRTFSTERRKFTVFTMIDPAAGLPVSAGLAYARSLRGADLDRDVASASVAYTASPDLYFAGQAEVDLHARENQQVTSSPTLTSLFANVSYRPAPAVTLGAGVTAWRPVFPFSAVSGIADSLLDRRLWASPSVSVGLSQAGFSLHESFAPRSSQDGFGREFHNSATLGAWNIFEAGTNLRGTWTTNVTTGTRTHGYAVSADQRLTPFADLTARWQYYAYTFTALGDRAVSRAIGGDLVVRIGRQFTVWTTYELASGFSGNYTHAAVDLTWRF